MPEAPRLPEPENPTSGRTPWDVVDEASFESFPASDPPGYGSAHAATAKPEEFLLRDSPTRPHALIAIDSAEHPDLARIATTMACYLERAGVIVDIADIAAHAMPEPPDYELVVVGMTVSRFGHHALLSWLAEGMFDVPSAVFVVGSRHAWGEALERISHTLDWYPRIAVAFRTYEEPRIVEAVDRLTELLRET